MQAVAVSGDCRFLFVDFLVDQTTRGHCPIRYRDSGRRQGLSAV